MFRKLQTHFRLLAAVLVLATSLGFGLLQAQPAGAAPIDVLNKCDNGSKVCAGTNKNTLFGVIKKIINTLITVAAIIAVIMIVIGGIRYTTSAGDAGQTKNARDTIIYAVVGLVVAVMSFALVNFVLGRI